MITLAVNDLPLGGTIGAVKAFLNENPHFSVEWNLNSHRLPLRREVLERVVAHLRVGQRPWSIHLPFVDAEIASHDDLVARTAVGVIKAYMKALAPYQPYYFNLHVATDAYEDEVSFERGVQHLFELQSFAKELGVKLAVENLRRGFCSRPDLFRRLVLETGSYVTFDFGHAKGSDWVGKEGGHPLDFVRGLEARLLAAHIYDVEDSFGHHVPGTLDPLLERLDFLTETPAKYWVLEVTSAPDMWRMNYLVRQYLDRKGIQYRTGS